MLPSVKDLTHDHENCYSFVIGIAKRARKIAEKANEENILLDEKPVKLAIHDYVEGKFRIAPERAQKDEQPSGEEKPGQAPQ